MTPKLEQERINNQKLTFEIRNAQRALVQEVGEDIPISKVYIAYIYMKKNIKMNKEKRQKIIHSYFYIKFLDIRFKWRIHRKIPANCDVKGIFIIISKKKN